MKVAIIGAGFAASVLYHKLQSQGHDVTVFEKSRGPGGRCATRYIEDFYIDHGTPFFSADHKAFANFCTNQLSSALYLQNGLFYPKSGMHKICASLIHPNDLYTHTKITSVSRGSSGHILATEIGGGFGPYDLVCTALPSVQAKPLCHSSPLITQALEQTGYSSIATLMLYTNEKTKLPQELADKPYCKKVVDNASKYGFCRASYVIHLHDEAAKKLQIDSKEAILQKAVPFISKDLDFDLQKHFTIKPHFWKYAFAQKKLAGHCLYDRANALAVCGDFFEETDLQGAFMSASALAQRIASE